MALGKAVDGLTTAACRVRWPWFFAVFLSFIVLKFLFWPDPLKSEIVDNVESMLYSIKSSHSQRLYEGRDIYELQKAMVTRRDSLAEGCEWRQDSINITNFLLPKNTRSSYLHSCEVQGESVFAEKGFWSLKKIGPFLFQGNQSIRIQIPRESLDFVGGMRALGASVLKDDGELAKLPDFHIHHIAAPRNLNLAMACVSDFECLDEYDCKDIMMQTVFPRDTVFRLDSSKWPVNRSEIWIEDFRAANSTGLHIYVQMSAFILHDDKEVKNEVNGMYALNFRDAYLPVDKNSVGWSSIQFNTTVEFFHTRPHSHGMAHSIFVLKGLPSELGLGSGKWERKFNRHFFEIPENGEISYALEHIYSHLEKSNSTTLLCHIRQYETRFKYPKGMYQRFNLNSFRECNKASWIIKPDESLTTVTINFAPGREYMQHNALIGWFLADTAVQSQYLHV